MNILKVRVNWRRWPHSAGTWAAPDADYRMEKREVVPMPVDPKTNADDVPGFEEFTTWYGDSGYGADD